MVRPADVAVDEAAPPMVMALREALREAHGILPDQGPIGVFVHHNTLHHFQHLPFHEGVQAGSDLLGAAPYLSLDAFRAAVRRGRIPLPTLRLEIARTLGARGHEVVLEGLSLQQLWEALLLTEADRWDDDALRGLRVGDAERAPSGGNGTRDPLDMAADRHRVLACAALVARHPSPDVAVAVPRRHRDALVASGMPDTDPLVHAELMRLAAGFLDHGQARWVLPERHRGFLHAVARLYAAEGRDPRGCPGVADDFRRVAHEAPPAERVVLEVLEALGVAETAASSWLLATLLAFPGWGGMFARLERHPDEHTSAPVHLVDFLAVRLLLERRALARAVRATECPLDWNLLSGTLATHRRRTPREEAVLLWQVTAYAGIGAGVLDGTDTDAMSRFWTGVSACSPRRRQQLFLEAYERSYREPILDALAARRALPNDPPSTDRVRAQFVFCIDEREESIRRAIEEQHPRYETFGTAGFFGVAIDYLGLDDHAPAAHCPVVVTPAHEVHEQPVYTALDRHADRQRSRTRWLGWERQAASASRTLTGGAGLSFLLGPLSGLKTLARVAAPRSSRRFGERLAARLAPPPATRLSTLRLVAPAATRSSADGTKPVGFSLEESVDRVTAVLQNLGLMRDFAPIIIVLGHGSTSLNNPHESAHDCGACGGRRGGANARLFADMANRPDVRDGVRQRGIPIPADCWFVGALHDTANDAVQYFDLETLPAAAVEAFEEAADVLERARRESARERCRRFDDVPLTVAPDEALRHVEARSAHLAQPRPEYGHCTNAMAIVGRRALTRGLYLDRRAFLISYDPTLDREHRLLERILAAVGPVGAGISLEYYFSSVDTERFGCGTKLPHNVTGLIGIMNGHQGDLRTGLPLQMVEIHEPMRLLLIVDASPEALLAVASRQAEVAELVTNAWIQLVAWDPETGAMHRFEDGQFVPYVPQPVLLPVVEDSAAWYRQGREHLAPALVRRALPAAAVGPGHHGGLA